MSEPGHEQETGQRPQGPETQRIPVLPSASGEAVPASDEAGTFPWAALESESESATAGSGSGSEPADPRGAAVLPPAGFPAAEPGEGTVRQAGPPAAGPGGGWAGAPYAALGQSVGRLGRWRLAFRSWRRSRPFWGGLLATLGGAEILLTYRAAFGVVLHFGLYGLAGYLVPALLTLLGLLIVFDPVHRTFYSVLAVLAALGTWLTSNLGGFMIGMLLGLVGGSLAFGWQQGERTARKRRRVRAGATG